MDLIQKIITRWYIIAAVLILFLGIKYTFENYPLSSGVSPDESISLEDYSKVLNKVKSSQITLNQVLSNDSTTIIGNPFRIMDVKPVKKIKPRGRKSAPPAIRNFILKGITNGQTAILLNNSGQSVVVEIGDVIDGTKVIKITTKYIKMKDKSGTFTLELD